MSHQHDHSHKEHQHEHHPPRKSLAKRVFVVAVVLMLVAMVVYVVTVDEAVEPGGQINQEVPADAE
jgi:Co/Zn/Cd efflux system component